MTAASAITFDINVSCSEPHGGVLGAAVAYDQIALVQQLLHLGAEVVPSRKDVCSPLIPAVKWGSIVNKPPEYPHRDAVSVNIPKPQVLAIRQIFESMLLALLLVHGQRIPSCVLAPQHHVQYHGNAHQDSIATDNTLPNTRVVVADFLSSDQERANDISCEKKRKKSASHPPLYKKRYSTHQHNT